MRFFFKKSAEIFGHIKKKQYLCTRFEKINGAIAQLVEQRTENPCVPGSIPGGTTEKRELNWVLFFCVAKCVTHPLNPHPVRGTYFRVLSWVILFCF